MGTKYLYYDSGTSNTRAYLLDEDFSVLYTAKKMVGSRDSSIAGSNRVLMEGLKELYDHVLEENGLAPDDIECIYASGMITSPYGIKEVPHLVLPMAVQEFAGSLYRYYEDTYFHRDIVLIPGLKTVNEDFSFVGNMRGEEIEILGTLDELRGLGITKAALLLPGSHTHAAYIEEDVIVDIISNFTGELFYALKTETIMAPVLSAETKQLDRDMVRKALDNLNKFGFNRALYICHAMRIMDTGTPEQRFSYGEGVINGGVRTAVEYYCEHRWKECDTLVVVADEFMYQLFSIIFEGCPYIQKIVWLPITEGKSYAVAGLKKLCQAQRKVR